MGGLTHDIYTLASDVCQPLKIAITRQKLTLYTNQLSYFKLIKAIH